MILATDGNDLVLAVQNKLFQLDWKNESYKTAEILPETLKKIEISQNCIVAIATQNGSTCASTNDKQLVLFDNDLKSVAKWTVQRAPSNICFRNSNEIILADKTGDVYLYKVNEPIPKLILGHLSMILTVALSLDGKFVITADRDEKIRVTCLPETYNIQSFCLGHLEFVTNIRVLDNKKILSTSGDGTIRVWDILSGEELTCIDCNTYISDKTCLEKFVSEMKLVNVNVNTLPLTSVAVTKIEGDFLIAVTVYKLNEIFIFDLKSNLEYNLVETINIIEPVQSMIFLDQNLFVLSNSLICFCRGIDKKFLKSENNFLRGLYNGSENLLIDDSLSVMYKRSFDNVQEYQERKKRRMDEENKE